MTTIDQARKIILDTYSEQQLADGEAFAGEHGYGDAEEFFSLAMSKILYSAEEVAAGARYPVEPGSLDDYFSDDEAASIYTERQSDNPVMPTHWIRGMSSTALSVDAASVEHDDVSTAPRAGWTPASLSEGVYYLCDEAGDVTAAVADAASYAESSDDEWLGTYWSEVLTDGQREQFGDFGAFSAAVRAAR